MSIILIGGGGSGGHLFPAIAVAEALKEEKPSLDIEFVGAKKGIEAQILPAKGFVSHLLPISGYYRTGIFQKITALFGLAFSIFVCAGLILRKKPKAILGVGGYSSAPLLLAALLLRKPFFIQEQNVVPGMVNRFLGKKAKTAFLALEGALSLYKNPLITGNPIRKEIVALSNVTKNFEGKVLTLTVLGGSQGARILNSTMQELFPLLDQNQLKWKIICQTGKQDYDQICKAAEKVSAEILVYPFIEKMDEVYRKTDLVLSRAGSGIYEYLVAGIPSVLVPIPNSSGDHQKKNAEQIAKKRAGQLIHQTELTAKKIELILKEFSCNRDLLREMSENAKNLFSENPAQKIAQEILYQS